MTRGTSAPYIDAAPFYDTDSPGVFHDRTDCPLAASIPAERRRLDIGALRARLSGW